MKLIDVDSKATLEDFLTLKKRLNLYSFYGNVMKKSPKIRHIRIIFAGGYFPIFRQNFSHIKSCTTSKHTNF